MRTQFSKFAFSAAFGLAMAFIFGCSSEDSPSNGNQPNIDSGTEISSSSGGGSGNGNGDGSSSPSGNGSSSSGNSGGSLLSSGGNGFSSSSLGQSSSSVVLKECDAIFNPDNKFCYDGVVYDKCGGIVYSPASEICQDGYQVILAICGDIYKEGEGWIRNYYNPLTQDCCKRNGSNMGTVFSKTTERCTNGVAEAKCENIWYNIEAQFCYDDIVYNKCGAYYDGTNSNAESYNPLTQGCISSEIVETKCGSNFYNQKTQFCVDNKIYNKCDGMEYPPASHICVNNVATPAKCNGESYNPLTQFCGNSTIKNYDFITDTRDGIKYKTTVIGTQTWMAENLNYAASGSKCYYDEPAYCVTYGRLYDWATAMNLDASCNSSSCSSQISAKHQGICPSGWHIPSSAELITLTNSVGANPGTKLKATNGWNNNGNGTDDYGFSVLPGGVGGANGGFGSQGGLWWCSDGSYIQIGASYESVVRDRNGSFIYISVRCLKD